MLLVIGVLLVFGLAAAFVVCGVIHDARVRSIERRTDTARTAMASILFEDESTAAEAFPALLRIPRTVLLNIVQDIAADVGDSAQDRLRALVVDARLAHRIVRRARSRAWRRRVQAAHVQHLLPAEHRDRLELLADPHPLVRARAAESLPRDDVVANAPRLLEMLDDEVQAVRAGAQQALLRGDTRLAEPICEYLWSGPRRGTNLALEIVANLPDPRYGPVLTHFATDLDPVRRAMVARALGTGTTLDAEDVLVAFLADDDPTVRATAAVAVGAQHATRHVAALGRLLSDPSWNVRREAALALNELGPPGAVVLRAHLFDDDRYARDMARQVLDAAATRRRQPPVIAPEELANYDALTLGRRPA